MPRDLLAKENTETHKPKSNQQENTKPDSASSAEPASILSQKDDEDFVPVNHEDFVPVNHEDFEDHDDSMNVDDHTDDEPTSSPPGTGAGLQRMSGNLVDPDEDSDQRFLHPLMNHLQGRLLGRGGAARNSPNKFAPLHPYTQVLSLTDLDECIRVENEAFPENERCSREKFVYRLTKCPELCYGVFSKLTLSEAKKAETPDRPELIAHIICTRTPAPCVTDQTMALPPHWDSKRSSLPAPGEKEPLGHQDQGATICIHSLAVGKAHQRKGLGSVLLKSFVQRIKDARIAERVALLSHDHLVGFYKSHGFDDMGPSAATFGGGNWRNMVLEFEDSEE